MELTEKATTYAEGKVNEVLTAAIAQAYTDGYRDGYKDCEDKMPMELREDELEYVDLGLPSGTLWANHYKKGTDGYSDYLPYHKAALLNIPTKEQWEELLQICKIISRGRYGFVCIGPNGNSISIKKCGYKEDDVTINPSPYFARFWIKDNKDSSKIVSVKMFYNSKKGCEEYVIVDTFSGYKLPIQLIRTK